MNKVKKCKIKYMVYICTDFYIFIMYIDLIVAIDIRILITSAC